MSKLGISAIDSSKQYDDELIEQIAKTISDLQQNTLKAARLFGQLSGEGIRKAKVRFKGILSAKIIDKLVASGKIGYPEFMIMTAGIDPAVWRRLEPEAKTVAQNASATVEVYRPGKKGPVIKAVSELNGQELGMVFQIGCKGPAPIDKQRPPAPPKTKPVNQKALDDYEEATSVLPTGSEYVLITGSRGSKIKVLMKTLKSVIR